jgi:hypothetical protein
MLEQLAADEESLAIVCFSLVGIVAIMVFGLGGTLMSVLRLSAHTRLKQQMLERGMSALEIEQVLKAGSDGAKGKCDQPTNPPQREIYRSATQPSKVHI